MIIGIGTKIMDLRRPKGPTTPPPPGVTWYIELENGLGFLELENTIDLLLQEAAP
jgi:hypothetical protein